MQISTWIHVQLEIYKDWLILLGVLSSIFTIVGFNMASLWNWEFSNWNMIIISILLAINTLITIILLYWLGRKKVEIKIERDRHVKETVELINLCRRLRDNLYQLNNEFQARKIKVRIPDGMHKSEKKLDASIVLMEEPSDLITESDRLFEKYNL